MTLEVRTGPWTDTLVGTAQTEGPRERPAYRDAEELIRQTKTNFLTSDANKRRIEQFKMHSRPIYRKRKTKTMGTKYGGEEGSVWR